MPKEIYNIIKRPDLPISMPPIIKLLEKTFMSIFFLTVILMPKPFPALLEIKNTVSLVFAHL